MSQEGSAWHHVLSKLLLDDFGTRQWRGSRKRHKRLPLVSSFQTLAYVKFAIIQIKSRLGIEKVMQNVRKRTSNKCEQLLYTTISKAVIHYFEYICSVRILHYKITKRLKFSEDSFLSKQIALFRFFIFMKRSKYLHLDILNVLFKLMPTTAQSKLFSKLDKSAEDFLLVSHHLRNILLPCHLPSLIKVIIYVCSSNTT